MVAPLITDPPMSSFTTLFQKKKKKNYMDHMTCDTRHVTRDTWHMTRYMRHMTGGEGKPSLKIPAHYLLRFGSEGVGE